MLIDAQTENPETHYEDSSLSIGTLNPSLPASGRRAIESRIGLDWSKLVVMTMSGALPNQVSWNAGPNVFPAETCARHIYVGLKDDFGDVGEELLQDKKTGVYSGLEAYRFFVEFYTGLKGHYHADKAASGQTRRAWNQYVFNQPESYIKLKPYMDAMFHDGGLVITHILNQFWHRPTVASTAVKAANLTPDSRALLVCGAEPLSVDTIKSLGHDKPYTPKVLTLTHPDRNELNAIIGQIRRLKHHEAIDAELQTVAFENALMDGGPATNMFNAAAVFVCQPMTADQETELGVLNNSLCEAWQLRTLLEPGHNAKLIHLKGDPTKQGQTTGIWETLQPTDGFISLIELREKKEQQVHFVERVAEKAKEAIGYMTGMKATGDRVVNISFGANQPDMPLNYILARRPLGAPAQSVATSELVPAGR